MLICFTCRSINSLVSVDICFCHYKWPKYLDRQASDTLLQCSGARVRTGKVLEFDLGPGKLLEFEKKCFLSLNSPGIL